MKRLLHCKINKNVVSHNILITLFKDKFSVKSELSVAKPKLSQYLLKKLYLIYSGNYIKNNSEKSLQ